MTITKYRILFFSGTMFSWKGTNGNVIHFLQLMKLLLFSPRVDSQQNKGKQRGACCLYISPECSQHSLSNLRFNYADYISPSPRELILHLPTSKVWKVESTSSRISEPKLSRVLTAVLQFNHCATGLLNCHQAPKSCKGGELWPCMTWNQTI